MHIIAYQLTLCIILTFSSISARALDVFFVHSYHHQYPWVEAYFAAFRQQLNSQSLRDFQMDTKRIPAVEFQAKASQALALIERYQHKVIVVADDNAMKLVGTPAATQGYPVAFLGVNANPRQYGPSRPNLAGVLERPLLKRSVAQLKRIVPNVQKILVLMDDGVTTQAIIETSFNQASHQQINQVTVDVAQAESFSHWQTLVQTSLANGYDLIIIANFAKLADASGNHVPIETTARWTSQHSKVPVFGFWRFSVGEGKAAGGLVLSAKHQGIAASTMVNHLLNKGYFPLPRIRTPEQGQYLFSKSELKRWKLKLPDNIARQTEWLD